MLEKKNNRLQLGLENHPELNPIYVDFLEGQLAHRREYGGGKNQLVSKAVGLNKNKNITILDISCGLARDAFVFAYLGADVTAIERNPTIAALVKDAFERANKEEWFRALKFKFIEADAKTYLNEWIAAPASQARNDEATPTPSNASEARNDEATPTSSSASEARNDEATPTPSNASEARNDRTTPAPSLRGAASEARQPAAIHPQPDVIYFDPMFPEREKSALVKKEMRILKEVVGDDTDANEIFKLALTKAKKRVVIKRPKGAPHLNSQEPSLIYKGKSSRFDVYLT